MTARYVYKDLEEGQIRLLKLLPDERMLLGEIEHYEVFPRTAEQSALPFEPYENENQSPEVPRYHALSHHWDPRPDDEDALPQLFIKGQNALYTIPLRQSLFEALRAIRAKMRSMSDTENVHIKGDPTRKKSEGIQWTRYLWIDAICINQKSTEDKNTQLPLMGTIYNCALSVIVWLGMPDDQGRTRKGIEFVKELKHLQKLRDFLEKPEHKESWQSFAALTRKAWFTRLWIVQEIAAAREAVLLSDDMILSWDDFAGALSLFVSTFKQVRAVLAEDGVFAKERDFFGEIKLSGANILVETRRALLRKRKDGEIAEHRKSLEALLTSLSRFEVTDPHDIVYAILWLSSDAGPGKRGQRKSYPFNLSTPAPSPIQIRPAHQANSSSGPTACPAQTPSECLALSIPDQSPLTPAGSSRKRQRSATKPMKSRKRQRLESPIHTQTADSGGVPTAVTNDFALAVIPAITVSEQQEEQNEADESLPDDVITIDYKMPVYDLCAQVMKHIITTTERLDILCFHWAPGPGDGEAPHPSWLPYTMRNKYAAPMSGTEHNEEIVSRVHADPLIGQPGAQARHYLACGRTRARRITIDKNRILHANGHRLATITETCERATNAVIPFEWREALNWTDNSLDPPDIFWRTLVADKGPDELTGAPPDRFSFACKWAFELGAKRTHVDLKEVRNNGKVEAPLVEFLDTAIATTWNRKLFVSARCQNDDSGARIIGLGPGEAKVGDMICVLRGCAVPVLLRPKRGLTSHLAVPTQTQAPRIITDMQDPPLKEDCTLVGECYVDGFMHGECYKYVDDHGIPRQEFRIH